MKAIRINKFFGDTRTICVELDGTIKNDNGEVLTPTLCSNKDLSSYPLKVFSRECADGNIDVETLAERETIYKTLKKSYPNFNGEMPSGIMHVGKVRIPQHLIPHILAVKELSDAGLPIESAVHRIASIYGLGANDKDMLYLGIYYEQREQINKLIADYESDYIIAEAVK